MSKIVVVGANHAGTAAVNTILANSKENEVIVFDVNSNISFLGCGMALWIGNQISGPEGLFYSSKAALEAKGAKVFMETRVLDIDFERKIILAEEKSGGMIQQPYDKLILATGSLPVIPAVPGCDLKNVQPVKLYQHAQDVIEKLEDPSIKDIVVVGAGYIGVELAEAFKRHGRNVMMIDVEKTCLSAYYDEPFTGMMKENLEKNGIRLAFGEKVTELRGNGRVEEVVTNVNRYKADMVVWAVGFRPNTELGKKQLAQFRNGAYLVNKQQETSAADVYAIGDCATVYDNSTDGANYIALATNAVRSGVVAAHNVLGTPLESVGVQGSNGISIFDLKMVSTGLTLNKAKGLSINALATDYEDLQKPEFIESGNDSVKIRIVYDAETRVILGAQMASRHDISMGIHLFSLAIQEKVTVDKLALTDLFFLPHFNKPYNYITMAALGAN